MKPDFRCEILKINYNFGSDKYLMMAVGHVFRRFRSFQLFLSLIFTGEVVFALARPHTSDNHDFTRFPFHGPSIGLFDRAVAYNQTRCGRHYTPTISCKGFSSSRVAYYPNSVSSFQTSFLMRSGDINPNPGPVNSSTANPEPRQDGFNLRGLHTFYANARSIVNKLDLLELEMSQRNYDLIVLTETHLDHSILDSEIFPSHYTVFRKDRTTNGRHGGGVLIAVRDCIPATLRVTHQCESELLFIDLLFSHERRITLGVFYRPPGGDTKPLEDLRICIQELNSTAELILLGDFNLPDIDWSCNRALHQSDIYVHLIDIIQDNFLTQLVREPTRNQNILDLVISTSPDIVDRLLVGDCFSDHRSLSFRILCSPYVQRKSQKLLYSYSKTDWTHLKSLLSYIPWSCAFFDDDIDYNWSCWKDLLFTAMDQCIPLCQSKRKSNAPWITKVLIKLCRKKKSLYSKARKSANPVLWEKYRKLNNAVKRGCNQARWTYINNMASELDFSGDSKPFWNYVKRKRNGTNNLVSLNVGDEVLTDDSSIASSLNSYFSSVFTTEDLANMPSLEPTVSEKLDVISCTSGEVMKCLKSLKPNKSPGPDRISPVILRSCASELAPSISYLVNKSFQLGHLPEDWRSSRQGF